MTARQNIWELIPYHNGIEPFNYDIVVDWAIDLIQQGTETDDILILASFSKPVDSAEIKPYLNAVLTNLGFEEKTGDETVLALIRHHLLEILNESDIRKHLDSLYDLFLEKDCFHNDNRFGLRPFYLLYHGWIELEDIGVNDYFEGANLNSIENVLKEQAQIWIDKYIN